MNGMKRLHFNDGDSQDEGLDHKRQRTMLNPAGLQTQRKLPAEEKISNFMISLGDLLEEDGLEKVAKLVGQDSMDQCFELRNSLRKQLHRNSALFETLPEPEKGSFDSSKFPSSLLALTVTPWKSSEIPTEFPALPAVLDTTLEVAAFTHQGIGSGRVGDLSYERLEWVGDSYLQIISTLLISQTFPTLLPGKCSQLRERLVKNITLEGYARQYGFDKRAKIPDAILSNPSLVDRKQNLTKIYGDIFEAYVAAIVLSDPKDGVARVTDWLKKLWGMTIRKEIINEEKSGMQYDSPMWNLRGVVDKVEITSSGPVQLGPKEQLQKLLSSKGVKLTYKDAAPERKDKSNKLPLFTVGVYLDGLGEKDKQLGFGTANGKKDAGKKAAAMALANKNLMKDLLEKKKIHDAQMEQERQAMETAAGT